MKKIVISFVILFSIFLVVGFTTNKGSYKPGTYYGYDIDISNKFENEARATVYIDDKGNFHHRHYSVVSEWEKSYNKNFRLYKHIPLDKKIKAITVVQTD